MKQINKTLIKRGDLILTEKPFVFVLQSKYRKDRCDNCLKATKVLKCSTCQYVYYCNRDCQMQAWAQHKIECAFLKRIYPRTVPDAARMLCKLIIKLSNGGNLERGYYTETSYRKFPDLMSHYTEIKKDPARMAHFQCLNVVLAEMMHKSTIMPNSNELLSIYGRLVTNGFNILDAEMNAIATAIYLGVSVTDHSCRPNAVATFEGTTLCIHATETIECLDWSKIFISYIELLNTTEERQHDLKSNYYFYCICSKCLDFNETREMNAASCPNTNCNVFLDITEDKCPLCQTNVNTKYRSAFNEAMVLTKTHLDKMKEVAYLDVLQICLSKQKDYLHPLNLWHIKTLDAAFEAYIELGKWVEALEIGRQLIPGYRKYYGDWHPMLGLLHMKLGKIELYKNYLNEAATNLKSSIKILEITHGQNHSLVKEMLLPLLMQAINNFS